MTLEYVGQIILNSFQNIWMSFVTRIPAIVGAIAVFIVGLIVAAGVGAVVEKLFESVKLDRFLGKTGITPHLERAGLKLRGAYFLGRLTYWFILVVFLLAASDILQLSTFSAFLTSVLAYIPNVIAAVLILLAALVIGNFLRRIVMASVMSARLHAGRFLGTLAWWSVVVFGLLAALVQLNIASEIINSILTGIIAMIALAGGIAFGLGGKDYANHLMGKFKDVMENR